jgi:hypothetical protein
VGFILAGHLSDLPEEMICLQKTLALDGIANAMPPRSYR